MSSDAKILVQRCPNADRYKGVVAPTCLNGRVCKACAKTWKAAQRASRARAGRRPA